MSRPATRLRLQPLQLPLRRAPKARLFERFLDLFQVFQNRLPMIALLGRNLPGHEAGKLIGHPIGEGRSDERVVNRYTALQDESATCRVGTEDIGGLDVDDDPPM